MRSILFILSIYFVSCSSLKISGDEHYPKKDKSSYRICFWNVKNLSQKGLERDTKGKFILNFSKSCDIIAFQEIRSANIEMAEEFEKRLEDDYLCMEGDPKPEGGKRKEKYLACIKSDLTNDIEKIEFEDVKSDFARSPTLFLMDMGNTKVLIVPFHSTPGDKNELKKFQNVIDFCYKNFSDRRIFFGGDFNTGSNYQKVDFLADLPYFSVLVQLIHEPTTFANQNHDLIFTDPRTAKNCKGNVWRLDVLFPEKQNRKDLEKISDHFPISADCNFN